MDKKTLVKKLNEYFRGRKDVAFAYLFGSVAKGTGDAASDLDLAVSGLPPSVFYRMGARVSDLIGRSVDLIDLDRNTPFTRYLRTETGVGYRLVTEP